MALRSSWKASLRLSLVCVQNQYVIIEAAELEILHGPNEPAITISEFIPPESPDLVYAGGGKSYYLLPDGPAGARLYAVLCRAMQQAGRHGTSGGPEGW